jgi:hypothetical protein
MKEKTPKEIVQQILKQYQTELVQEIEKATTLLELKRVYDAGRMLELALKNFLVKLLPSYVGITKGVIFSSDLSSHSEEIDLILYDKRYFPGFVIDNNITESISYISIDTVFGVISVKKTLDLKSWRDSVRNINSVYNLYRKSIKNQFHYNLGLNEKFLIYGKGEEVNKIFSCIFAAKNNFLYKRENRKKIKRSNDELIKYFDSFCSKGMLDSFRIDLIATLDGTIFFPVIYSADENVWHRSAETSILGTEKKAITPSIVDIAKNLIRSNIEDVILGYSIEQANPEKTLGQFITYIQIFSSSLVKSQPDIHSILKECFDSKINIIFKARTLPDVLKIMSESE